MDKSYPRPRGSMAGAAVVAALTAASLLAGCGGGGGDDEQAAVTPAGYPVEALVTTLFTTSNALLSSTFIDPAGRDDYAFSTRYEPQAQTALFEGTARQTATVTTTLERNGVTLSSTTGTIYYATAPLVWYGQTDSRGRYSVHEGITNLPASATIGASGTWFTSKDYTAADKATLAQTTRVDWYVSAADGAAAWVCLDYFVTASTAAAATHSASSCVKADSSGTILATRQQRSAAR